MIQQGMLKQPAPTQMAPETVPLDSLRAKDYLLCKIDVVMDFCFAHAHVAGLYCTGKDLQPLDLAPTVNRIERSAALPAIIRSLRRRSGRSPSQTMCTKQRRMAAYTLSASSARTITRHVWTDAREHTDVHRQTPWGKSSAGGESSRSSVFADPK